MKGKIIVIALGSFFVYLFLYPLLYFAPLFTGFGFGEKPKWYIIIIAFLRRTPFVVDEVNESGIFPIAINALFWTFCIAALLYFVARLTREK